MGVAEDGVDIAAVETWRKKPPVKKEHAWILCCGSFVCLQRCRRRKNSTQKVVLHRRLGKAKSSSSLDDRGAVRFLEIYTRPGICDCSVCCGRCIDRVASNRAAIHLDSLDSVADGMSGHENATVVDDEICVR